MWFGGKHHDTIEDNTWIQGNDSQLAIIFIHGITSSSDACWRNKKSSAYWPQLVATDSEFATPSVFVSGYASSITSADYNVYDIADETMMRLRTKTAGYSPLTKGSLLFVCHSQGGIVARRMLVTNAREFSGKRVGLFLCGSPSWGSFWGQLARPVTRALGFRQAAELAWGDTSLEYLDRDFLRLIKDKVISGLCGFSIVETKGPLGLPKVVSAVSATRYFSEWAKIPHAGHGDIVKPATTKHLSHVYLREFARSNGFFNEHALPGAMTNTSAAPSYGQAEAVPTYNISANATGVLGSATSFEKTPRQFEGEELIKRVISADDMGIVSDLLNARWTLSHLSEVLRHKPDLGFQIINSVARRHEQVWKRFIVAFVASNLDLKEKQLISLAFDDGLSWGARFPPLACLRFTPPQRRDETANNLLETIEKRPLGQTLDNERLGIFGLGFLGDQRSIWEIIDDNSALEDNYDNEKLGPFSVSANLRCFLETDNEREERSALRHFTETFRATEKCGNLSLGFSDYSDELQLLRPGKAIHLFRHFRDNAHKAPLTAVFAAISNKPNSLLLNELVDLAYRHQDAEITAGALHATAYIGSLAGTARLRECVGDGLSGAKAAWALSVGLSNEIASCDEIAALVQDSNLPSDAGWLDDVRHNAIWTVGEFGRVDSDYARKVLEPLCSSAHDPYGRALAWLGLAKAGRVGSRDELELAFESASNFFERAIISIASSLAGWPDLLIEGIRGTVENHAPLYRLIAHIRRDFQIALRDYGGEGGRAIFDLTELGDYT